MNKFVKSSSSSFSSSPTPPPPLPPPPLGGASSASRRRSSASGSAQEQRPSIISLEYDFPTMSPSTYLQMRRESSAFHKAPAPPPPVDTDIDVDQFGSLFGDPVPPPAPPASDYFDSSQVFRSNYTELSSEEDQPPPGESRHGRLFSAVPYSSSLVRRLSEEKNFELLSATSSARGSPTGGSQTQQLPRLEPPDIQILPNSSASSSSDNRFTPTTNYSLLTPNIAEMGPRPSAGLYEIPEKAQDYEEHFETMTIQDATGTRKYSEASQRVTQFAEDFKSNVGSLGTIGMDSSLSKKQISRQFSNESYSSSEWFRPAGHEFPEFSKIPRLRPSSKNVMQIRRDGVVQHPSPVATMIQDSNESSSGDDQRRLDTTQVLEHASVPLDSLTPPERPPNPSPSTMRHLEQDLLMYHERAGMEPTDGPPPIPPSPDEAEVNDFAGSMTPIRRENSPVIITNSIATGSEYRVETPRLHKKTSFSILSPKSPHTSRGPSPAAQTPKRHAPTSSSPTRSSRHMMPRKSLSSSHLKLPPLSGVHSQMLPNQESPRPSVQFNMTGRRSPSRVPAKGILQHRESLTSSQDTIPPQASPYRQRRRSVAPGTLPFTSDSMRLTGRVKSCETLPLITDPYRTAIPRYHRFAQQPDDARRESPVIPPGALPRPIKPNPNPTRQQRGLLRVINSADSMTRIPVRSNWASMDDLTVERQKRMRRTSLSPLAVPKGRRRSSSTSPERRSSTVTASDRRSSNLSSMTTSDFSFRRPSIALQSPLRAHQARRKSIMPSKSPTAKRKESLAVPARGQRNKLVKPSTLSPIIGTPNKDSSTPQSPARGAARMSDSISDSGSRRTSISKIPLRNGSTSRPVSRGPSRSSSPLKQFSDELLKDLTHRVDYSRSHSRSNSRADSRPASRADSRPASRADSRPISRADSRPISRADSRPTSRVDSRPISRSPSRQPSRSPSRQPSRSPSRASTRPISRGPSRAGSRPSSRMEQAREIANSRSNSRLSMHSVTRQETPRGARVERQKERPFDRRKSVSLSPPRGLKAPLMDRRRSISPPGKKRMGPRASRTSQSQSQVARSESQSRIPRRATSTSKGGRSKSPRSKSPAKREVGRRDALAAKKPPAPQPRKPPVPVLSKQPASAKKTATLIQKASKVTRTMSSAVEKRTKAKSTAESNRKAATPAAKRTNAAGGAAAKPSKPSGSTGKPSAAGASKAKPAGNVRETPSKGQPKAKETASEAVDGDRPSKTTETPAKSSHEAATATGTPTAKTPSTPTAKGTPTAGGMRRTPSTMSLKRMGSTLSLLSRKRLDTANKTGPPLTESAAEGADTADTAAEPAQPVQLAPAVAGQLQRLNSAGQLVAAAAGDPEMASAILEKSQKTLENVQKTVTVATDEIHKTINENLTDLKSLEQEYMGGGGEGLTSPTASLKTVVENRKGGGGGGGESVSRLGTADGKGDEEPHHKSPMPPGQPIEAAVSVLNGDHPRETLTASTMDGRPGAGAAGGGSGAGDSGGDAAERNYEFGVDERRAQVDSGPAGSGELSSPSHADDTKRRSPDGQGGSAAGSGHNNGSREFLKGQDDDDELNSSRGCCKCCTRLCMPCRRSRCSRCFCCRRKPSKIRDDSEEPVLSATSSATTTNLEVIDEKTAATDKTKAPGCWQKLNCCASCRKPKGERKTSPKRHKDMPAPKTVSSAATRPSGQGKCGLCLSKVFCCRSVNRVDTLTGDETEVKKCCFCIPCRRKRSSATHPAEGAWRDPESGIAPTDASVVEGASTAPMNGMQKEGCCKRFWGKLLCCRKKPVPQPGSRRSSMKAPPPPAEETRRKLHVDLVEYTSKMKAAIPVLPLYLAWFCAICNTVIPGLGTLLSGLFCVCIGIPRFSHYDSARARLGAFIINTVVAVAQLFCVLFCFVGWGWSIWWGTIMLKCARKQAKVKKVEKLEMEEEKRQAAAAAARVAANAEHQETMTKS